MIRAVIVKISYDCIEKSSCGAGYVFTHLLDAAGKAGWMDQDSRTLKTRYMSVEWEEDLHEDCVIYRSVVKEKESLYDRAKLFAR